MGLTRARKPLSLPRMSKSSGPPAVERAPATVPPAQARIGRNSNPGATPEEGTAMSKTQKNITQRPKAITREGSILGHVTCYVLEDGRRVITKRSAVAALSSSDRKGSDLTTYIERLPNGSELLATSANFVEFNLPGGRVGHGVDAKTFAKMLQLYAAALQAGQLRADQMPVALRAVQLLAGVAEVGIVALVDEATGYRAQLVAQNKAFVYRALLQESMSEWSLMWPAEFVDAICRLHGKRYTGGAQPAWLASTYEKIYRIILGDDAVDEMQRRNPEPKHGTNHHQWLTPEARAVVAGQVGVVTMAAVMAAQYGGLGAKERFWASLEHRYRERWLQNHFPFQAA